MNLRLFVLTPLEQSYVDTNGIAVLAHDEAEARAIAAAKNRQRKWTDPAQVECREESLGGEPRIVLADNPTG